MNFFSNIRERIKEKTAEMMEKKEFLTMVEGQAKPIRRAAYLEQKKKDAIKEGMELAKKDTEKKLPKKTKTPQDFGFGQGMSDPYKYLLQQERQKNNIPPKTNLTKSKKHKKK